MGRGGDGNGEKISKFGVQEIVCTTAMEEM